MKKKLGAIAAGACLGAMPLAAAPQIRADVPVITPLAEYADRNGSDDKASQRFIFNRCTSLHIFAASIAKDREKSLYEHHEIQGARFLEEAKAVSDRHEVMIMQLQRMASQYKARSDAYAGGTDPLVDPFIVAEMSFCDETLKRRPARPAKPTN